MLKHLYVVFWSVAPLRLAGRSVNRPHECDELIGNNPVQITIFDLLIVFVLFVVKVPKLVPTQTHSEFQPLPTVEHSALISARVPVACITEGLKL